MTTRSDSFPVAIVTGASAGLGLMIAKTFFAHGYRVMIVGRDRQRLSGARHFLADELSGEDRIQCVVADLTRAEEVAAMMSGLAADWGRLDVLVNCVGSSDRGLLENLAAEPLEELIAQNVTTALLCSQAALPLLEQSGGAIVNIGSLAAKIGARYMGGYSAAKHALAGLTQQMRLELAQRGIHVGLVSPGPIRRADAGSRYAERIDESLPPEAAKPGGGTKIKGLDPQRVANAVYVCASKRRPDMILPRWMRLFVVISHMFPRLGDWLLVRFG